MLISRWVWEVITQRQLWGLYLEIGLRSSVESPTVPGPPAAERVMLLSERTWELPHPSPILHIHHTLSPTEQPSQGYSIQLSICLGFSWWFQGSRQTMTCTNSIIIGSLSIIWRTHTYHRKHTVITGYGDYHMKHTDTVQLHHPVSTVQMEMKFLPLCSHFQTHPAGSPVPRRLNFPHQPPFPPLQL